MTARTHDDSVSRLRRWMREVPRAWETQRQFERRIRLLGERFADPLAQRWIDEELAHAAILWDPGNDEQTMEWSDLRCSTMRTADDAFRRMERAGGATFEYPAVEWMLHRTVRMREVAPSGDGPAFRDLAAWEEWLARDVRGWIELADAFEAAGETRAAEAFIVRALGEVVFADGGRAGVAGIREFRNELRTRLRDLIARNGTDDS